MKKPRKPAQDRKSAKARSPLTAAELRSFREQLQKLMKNLKGTVDTIGRKTIGKNPGSESGELSSLPIHMADIGSDVFEHDLNLNLVENESKELELIEEALERIDRGTFGICDFCHKPIPRERLRAIPYARLCVTCKQREEGGT